MLGLMQYPQSVLLHKQQKRPRTFLAILKYVAAQQPTDRQFRYSNRPIICSTRYATQSILRPLSRTCSEYIWTCVSNTWWKLQSWKCKIEQGIADKPFFRNCVIYTWYIGLSFGNISWWMTNWVWNLYRCSPCVFSIVSTKIHLDRKRRFFLRI